MQFSVEANGQANENIAKATGEYEHRHEQEAPIHSPAAAAAAATTPEHAARGNAWFRSVGAVHWQILAACHVFRRREAVHYLKINKVLKITFFFKLINKEAHNIHTQWYNRLLGESYAQFNKHTPSTSLINKSLIRDSQVVIFLFFIKKKM